MKYLGKNLLKRKDGTVAVEFSLIFGPLIFLVIGIIEMGLMFGAAAMLEGGTAQAARLIRTGQIQAEADPQAAFETELCSQVNLFIDCNELISEVILIPDEDFLDTDTYPAQFDGDGVLISSGFDSGGPNDVILVRVFYEYPFVTPLISETLAEDGTQIRRFVSTVVLKNEPYEF